MNYMGFLLGYAKISCLLVKSLKKEQRRSVNRVLENTAKSYHQFEIKKFFNDKANVKKHPGHVYPVMMGSLLGLSRLLHFSESSMEIAKIAHFGHRTLCELKRCSVHVPPELKERIERLGSYASFFGATKKPNWASLFFYLWSKIFFKKFFYLFFFWKIFFLFIRIFSFFKKYYPGRELSTSRYELLHKYSRSASRNKLLE